MNVQTARWVKLNAQGDGDNVRIGSRADVDCHPALRHCSAVDEQNTAQVRDCINQKQKLKIALDLHIAKTEEFNRLLNKVEAESPPSFRHSSHGLIGGMEWMTGIYAMNVPTSLSGEQTRRAREESERQFFARLKLAGIAPENFIDPRQYDFIIGVAESTNGFGDLTKRVMWDNLAKGRATPFLQKEYDLIRGRSFDVLDCHSNGAMICLAARKARLGAVVEAIVVMALPKNGRRGRAEPKSVAREEKTIFRVAAASAANLKFLSVSPQVRDRNFKFKGRTKQHVARAPFDSEVRIRGRRDSLRTSESEL